MKLKKDIQVKAFLIRNKIPFATHVNYLLINEYLVGEENLHRIKPYELFGEPVTPRKKQGPVPKRSYSYNKKYQEKDKVVIKLIEPEIEQPKTEQKRPPAVYSNPKFNT